MTKTMSIPDFVRSGWKEESKIDVFLAHLKRHKIKYQVIGTAIILFLGVAGTSFAMDPSSTGIDARASFLYKNKVLLIGKWVIIVKGAIDTIQKLVDGNFPEAKKNFLSYLMIYAILQGLPWGMDQIDEIFKEV
jgi:hypothetical protein